MEQQVALISLMSVNLDEQKPLVFIYDKLPNSTHFFFIFWESIYFINLTWFTSMTIESIQQDSQIFCSRGPLCRTRQLQAQLILVAISLNPPLFMIAQFTRYYISTAIRRIDIHTTVLPFSGIGLSLNTQLSNGNILKGRLSKQELLDKSKKQKYKSCTFQIFICINEFIRKEWKESPLTLLCSHSRFLSERQPVAQYHEHCDITVVF